MTYDPFSYLPTTVLLNIHLVLKPLNLPLELGTFCPHMYIYTYLFIAGRQRLKKDTYLARNNSNSREKIFFSEFAEVRGPGFGPRGRMEGSEIWK